MSQTINRKSSIKCWW